MNRGSAVTASSASAGSFVGKFFANKNTLVMLVLIAAVVGISYWVYITYLAPTISKNQTKSYGLTQNDITQDGEAELYLFKVNWCPHCKKALPVIEELRTALKKENNQINGTTVLIKVIDCDEEPDMADRFKIEGYPTIKLVKGQSVYDYEAKPEVGTLIQFLNSTL